jgi:hypothetical protein
MAAPTLRTPPAAGARSGCPALAAAPRTRPPAARGKPPDRRGPPPSRVARRWADRPFVQAPLADLLQPSDLERGYITERDPAASVLGRLRDAAAAWEAAGGEQQARPRRGREGWPRPRPSV